MRREKKGYLDLCLVLSKADQSSSEKKEDQSTQWHLFSFSINLFLAPNGA